MAKLSDIVGGLMRDLSQSTAVVDDHTRQLLERYQKDPVLSHFPVPRLTIRQATLRLKFVVKDQAAPRPDEDPTDYQAIWGKALRERIMPQVMERVGKLDNRAVVNTLAGRLSRPEVEGTVPMSRLLDPGQGKELAEETVALLLKETKSLPKSILRYLPQEELLVQAAREVVSREALEIQRAATKLHEARRAALSDLDITVNAEEIRQMPESQVSEIELTLDMEDIEKGSEP